MIIIGDDVDGISILMAKFSKQIEMGDLGSIRYLGIEVAYYPRGYLLFQSKYAANILKRVRLSDNKTIDISIMINAKYSFCDGVSSSYPTLYLTIVGSLVNLTITRPDIAYVVHVVSQFAASPTTVHWQLFFVICGILDIHSFRVFYFHAPL